MVNITERRPSCPRLIEQAQSGSPVIIGKAGRPVAVLSAYDPGSEPRVPGGWEGKVWIGDDFDAPLPAELQTFFSGPGS